MSLVLFVHGFLGSTDSFASFPNDLVSECPDASFKIYPTYNTKGNITKQVHALSDYLLIEANTSLYSNVILIGHSMGGILAVDVYNYLQSLEAVPQLVNIVKILSVDSPFFGLSKDLSKSSLWNVSEFTRETVHSLKESVTNINVQTTTGIITSTIMSTRMSGLMYFGKKVDQITDHLRFLYPIVEKREDQIKRFEFTNSEIFHGFYNRFCRDNDTFSYFCNLPPVELQEYFTPLDSKKNDEIQGHMYIFCQDQEDYNDLLIKISQIIKSTFI
jgi:esterase/lipase